MAVPRSQTCGGGVLSVARGYACIVARSNRESARHVSKLEKAVSEIVDEMRQMPDRGEVADYIPELAGVDPKSFGLVVIDAAGNVVAGGDGDVPFSIQSISKVFTLTLALGKIGNRLWERVGREPSGSRSIRLFSSSSSAASRAIRSSTPAPSP